MLLPSSGEQIRKLGERLASSAPISAEDDRALEELVASHLQALELTRPRLTSLEEAVGVGPLHITARAKTTGTIIEKLRRQGNMSLARMGDLAGFRIVGDFTFADQDRLAAEIARQFPADPREPKLIDRRARPSHGYRALHVAVSFDGVGIEVQTRTILQHVWANLMERLADRLGRQIRYGEPPTPPKGMSQRQAMLIVSTMMGIATGWASIDTQDVGVLDLDKFTEDLWGELRGEVRSAGVDL